MIDSKILIWTQSYDNKGPHFILIIHMIFKGFNYLDSNIFKPCNIDELGLMLQMVVCKGITLELQASSNFQ